MKNIIKIIKKKASPKEQIIQAKNNDNIFVQNPLADPSLAETSLHAIENQNKKSTKIIKNQT